MSEKREYPVRPLIGVGAIIVDHGRVVLVKRGHPPLAGEWSIPGGVLEVGETLREGVIREAREETGLTVEPLELLGVFDRVLRQQAASIRRLWCRRKDLLGPLADLQERRHFVALHALWIDGLAADHLLEPARFEIAREWFRLTEHPGKLGPVVCQPSQFITPCAQVQSPHAIAPT